MPCLLVDCATVPQLSSAALELRKHISPTALAMAGDLPLRRFLALFVLPCSHDHRRFSLTAGGGVKRLDEVKEAAAQCELSKKGYLDQ